MIEGPLVLVRVGWAGAAGLVLVWPADGARVIEGLLVLVRVGRAHAAVASLVRIGRADGACGVIEARARAHAAARGHAGAAGQPVRVIEGPLVLVLMRVGQAPA